VTEVIQKISVSESIERHEIDIGEKIGYCDLVTTTDKDEIVYAKRPLRNTYSRFVKNRTAEPTSWLTIDLRKQTNGDYVLYTAFFGRLVPSFPGGNFLPKQSKEFWNNHALVWGSQDIVLGSEMTNCPW